MDPNGSDSDDDDIQFYDAQDAPVSSQSPPTAPVASSTPLPSAPVSPARAAASKRPLPTPPPRPSKPSLDGTDAGSLRRTRLDSVANSVAASPTASSNGANGAGDAARADSEAESVSAGTGSNATQRPFRAPPVRRLASDLEPFPSSAARLAAASSDTASVTSRSEVYAGPAWRRRGSDTDARSTMSKKSFFTTLRKRAGSFFTLDMDEDASGKPVPPVPALDGFAGDGVRPVSWQRVKTKAKLKSGSRQFAGMSLAQTLDPHATRHHASPSFSDGHSAMSGDSHAPDFQRWHLDPADPKSPPMPSGGGALVVPAPWHEYRGHAGDILDLAWNRASFLASASTDKTVRVWHLTRADTLAIFNHGDFVTSVAFHPLDDRYFATSCFDGKLRLWSLDEKRLVNCQEVARQYLTAVQFTQDGHKCVVGTYSGSLMFYEVVEAPPGAGVGASLALRYHTQVTVKSRKGRNNKYPKKVTGIESWPETAAIATRCSTDRLLVSSNDSRLRFYDLKDKSVVAKLKGHTNAHSQIRASFSDDGRYAIWPLGESSSVSVNGSMEGVTAPDAPRVQTSAASVRSGTGGKARHGLAFLHNAFSSTFRHGRSKRSRAPTGASSDQTSTSGSPTGSNPSLNGGGSDAAIPPTPLASHIVGGFEAFEASSVTVTAAAFAPFKSRFLLEAAGVLPSPSADPTSVTGFSADYAVLAVADHLGAIRIFVNTPVDEAANANGTSGSSIPLAHSNRAPSVRSVATTATATAHAPSGRRMMRDLDDDVGGPSPPPPPPPPPPPLPVMQSTHSLPGITGRDACPYCGGMRFKLLHVLSGSDGASPNDGESGATGTAASSTSDLAMARASGRIIVCLGCMKVLSSDSAALLS
ncbi:hypothetical protein AMAG_18451 [Allomyces macrogynus ATCC 38327]|uniref:Uncharacterized protein n=1 Tax=Allomyces macrogynus (strain ATCC 38327) TaxID=578462 RepID=A0A0L0SC34_ALLM3|nr:hypothetical protein AMAG_18451 [Allomyces macrogynus ATCC 38327]|eukprot:KNE59969.1 hypothetical protein AMAG_18451 [Allomyces macrogynus ATCC 38327]